VIAALVAALALPLTAHVPARIDRLCASIPPHATVPVHCPRLVPALPLEPYFFAVQGGAWLSGRLYEVDVRMRLPDGTELHWNAGGGEPRAVQAEIIDGRHNEVPGRAARIGSRRIGGRLVRLYRFPVGGGPSGGHDGAFVHVGRTVYWVSVHGSRYDQTALAMLSAMLRP
jgi:hypothetical protein